MTKDRTLLYITVCFLLFIFISIAGVTWSATKVETDSKEEVPSITEP